MDLSDWRDRIDAVDGILLDLLNRRIEYALEIGRIKRAQGTPILDEKREEDVLAGLKSRNRGPLSSEGVVGIFSRIVEETRDLERAIEDGSARR